MIADERSDRPRGETRSRFASSPQRGARSLPRSAAPRRATVDKGPQLSPPREGRERRTLRLPPMAFRLTRPTSLHGKLRERAQVQLCLGLVLLVYPLTWVAVAARSTSAAVVWGPHECLSASVGRDATGRPILREPRPGEPSDGRVTVAIETLTPGSPLGFLQPMWTNVRCHVKSSLDRGSLSDAELLSLRELLVVHAQRGDRIAIVLLSAAPNADAREAWPEIIRSAVPPTAAAAGEGWTTRAIWQGVLVNALFVLHGFAAAWCLRLSAANRRLAREAREAERLELGTEPRP